MPKKIGVLTIGDELLSGELSDTNTARIARFLGGRGLKLRESSTVGDVELDIEEALLDLTRRLDLVIVTGGLGPTADDLTARMAARAFGRRLVLNDEALSQIRDHFRRSGREMHPRNEKQALLPQKITVIPNHRGTAPGFHLTHNGKTVFFLPGVPEEMVAMFETSVLPAILERCGVDFPRQERIFHLFGLTEPKIEEILRDVTFPGGIQLAFGVDFPLVLVKLRAEGEEAERLLDRGEVVLRQALGDFLVAVGEESMAGNVARMLTAAGLTLAVAESCTGGLIAKMLTDLPGASAFFDRSAVTYADRAKAQWLGVSEAILSGPGAVSEACALAMARGLRQNAGTDLAIAVTGIAGPGGGSPAKPVGTVYLAMTSPQEEMVKGYRFGGDRQQIRTLTAFMAFEWLRRYLVARMERTAIDSRESAD